VVIAIFYTAQVHWEALGLAAVILAGLVAVNRLGLRRPEGYAVLGLALWVAIFESGIHATVAGILLAFTIPASTRINPSAFLSRSRRILDAFEHAGQADPVDEYVKQARRRGFRHCAGSSLCTRRVSAAPA